ncbi:MAG: hypothetical protein CMJ19_14035 [Phycisphaeraceae bacterium]|nr:hypothetical protein [Phycisphaeraceae bacterium]
MNKFFTIVSFFIFSLIFNNIAHAQIKPDHELQKMLKSLADDEIAPKDFTELLNKILKFQKSNEKHFFEQLIYSFAYAKTFREGLVPGVVLERSDVSKEQVQENIVDLLDSKDKAIVQKTEEWILSFETQDNCDRLNFTAYIPRIRKSIKKGLDNGRPEHMALVRHMFKHDPQEAILVFNNSSGLPVEVIRSVLWMQHLVGVAVWRHENKFDFKDTLDAAKNEIGKAVHSQHWWVRLYVAAILKKYEIFNDEQYRKMLKDDDCQLVKEFLGGDG